MTDENQNLGAELMSAFELAPKQEAPAQQQAEQPQAETPAPQEETLEAQEQTGQIESAADNQTTVKEAVEGDDDYYLITDLAKDLEVEPADLYGVVAKTPSGKAVTFGEFKDLVESGAIDGDGVSKQRAEIDQYREQVRQQVLQERDQILQQAQQQSKVPEKVQELSAELMSLRQRYQSVDWAKLEQDDPGQAALLKTKFHELYATTEQDLAGAKQEAEQQDSQRMQQVKHAAAVEFAKRVPEWADEKVRDREIPLIAETVTHYGFTEQELSTTLDPRIRHLLRDYAVLRHQAESANANAKKVVGKGNRVLREAALAKRTTRSQAGELSARARESRKKGDIFAAQKALLGDAGLL